MATQSKNPFANIKKGALHKMLGIKQGDKIPASRLHEALHSKSPLERKRANFALNAKKFVHKKKVSTPMVKELGLVSKKSIGMKGDVEKKASKKMKGAPSTGQQPGAQGTKEMKSAKRKKASINLNSPANYGKAMSSAMKNTKVFGAPASAKVPATSNPSWVKKAAKKKSKSK